MLTMAVGHSDDVDPRDAVGAAIEACRSALDGRPATAGLLFSTADVFDPSLVRAVREAFPGIALAGCTSSAELSSVDGYREDSITLAVFSSDSVEFGTGLGPGLGQDVEVACRAAVDRALDGTTKEPKVCLVLHESFVVDPPLVVEALARILPDGVPILGGTSARSDFTTMTPTFQFADDEVASDGVAVMVLCGPVAVSTAVGLGFKTIGSKGTVTRVAGAEIEEIDGRPATEFLHRYVDATGPAAYANPLAVFVEGDEEFLLRAVRPSEPGSGALATAGSVPLGAGVQLTTADSDDVLAGTRDALERALAGFPAGATPEAAIVFSCAVRKFFLGSRTRVEAEIARDVLGDLPTVGLYCYGEVGPVAGAPISRFLNETFVTLLLGT
jgi:hypothetical protein